MDSITSSKLYDLYLDTLQCGSSESLHRSDEEIESILFEDFDTGITSFLHDDTLNQLVLSSYINEDVRYLSLILREKALSLMKETEREAGFIRNSSNWKDIFISADEILRLIETSKK